MTRERTAAATAARRMRTGYRATKPIRFTLPIGHADRLEALDKAQRDKLVTMALEELLLYATGEVK